MYAHLCLLHCPCPSGSAINVIPGSHLYRDPDNCRGSLHSDGIHKWMDGKTHPVTGQPLREVCLPLPPGSIVCINSHGAHAVSPTAAHHSNPRRAQFDNFVQLLLQNQSHKHVRVSCAVAMSFFYFRRSRRTGHVQPPAWLTPPWALKGFRGELPPLLTSLFRSAWDSNLTAGRNTMQQP
eukprot:SAG31_NODE_623_length_13492_cov_62.118196_8_plen_180_part_00